MADLEAGVPLRRGVVVVDAHEVPVRGIVYTIYEYVTDLWTRIYERLSSFFIAIGNLLSSFWEWIESEFNDLSDKIMNTVFRTKRDFILFHIKSILKLKKEISRLSEANGSIEVINTKWREIYHHCILICDEFKIVKIMITRPNRINDIDYVWSSLFMEKEIFIYLQQKLRYVYVDIRDRIRNGMSPINPIDTNNPNDRLNQLLDDKNSQLGMRGIKITKYTELKDDYEMRLARNLGDPAENQRKLNKYNQKLLENEDRRVRLVEEISLLNTRTSPSMNLISTLTDIPPANAQVRVDENPDRVDPRIDFFSQLNTQITGMIDQLVNSDYISNTCYDGYRTVMSDMQNHFQNGKITHVDGKYFLSKETGNMLLG